MAAAAKKFLLRVIPQTKAPKPQGTIIFLHGSGDSGAGIQSWVNNLVKSGEFSFPHLRVLFPTAPVRPYTAAQGQLMNVWYDRAEISPDVPEEASTDEQAMALGELIKAELELGVTENKIIVGGFSMGGGMALHLGYRFYPNVAGVFALSSFLATESKVYETLKSKPPRIPPLFQAHGEWDELVLYPWGKDTHNKLISLGVSGKFHSLPGHYHEMDPQNIAKLITWINELVPEQRDSTG